MTGLLMSDLVPRHVVGTAVALMSALGAATGAIFNLCVGPLIETMGYATLLTLCSLLHPVAAGILWWSYRKKPNAPFPADAALGKQVA